MKKGLRLSNFNPIYRAGKAISKVFDNLTGRGNINNIIINRKKVPIAAYFETRTRTRTRRKPGLGKNPDSCSDSRLRNPD